MALYLVQHGKSLPKDKDPEQGLSEEGRLDADRIASVAQAYKVRVDGIRHSGKKRAEQTAEVFAAALKPEGGITAAAGMNPLDDVAPVAVSLRNKDNLMLVGHLPFMERLTSYLITGSHETLVFKFQNAGIVCLDQDPQTDTWFIRWALMPKIG